MKKAVSAMLGFCTVTAVLIMLLFIPPSNYLVIFGVIITSAFSAFFISQIYLSFKYGLLAFTGTFAFLMINFLVGFQLLNTVLLISVIIGITFLIKK